MCPACREPRGLLFSNSGCSHAACLDCWTACAAQKVARGRRQASRRVCFECIVPNCAQIMAGSLIQLTCQESFELMDFKQEMDTEVTRLTKMPDQLVSWGCEAEVAGPRCPCCNEHRVALLVNTECGHAACRACWTSSLEQKISYCRDRRLRLCAGCLAPGCGQATAQCLVNLACAHSPSLKAFQKETDEEVARLTKVSDQTLFWGHEASHAGPECPVCRERCLALLCNAACGHSACEDCWASWTTTFLAQSRWEKKPSVRCFGPSCNEPAAAALWAHSCTRNDGVYKLEAEFAWRRRLKENVLFPAEVQVDCPNGGCLGLGYRGYDTLMCFVCEHQWPATDAGVAAPPDVPLETMVGEVMKRCPACGEYIIKNGGCDHMTCRCRHEFWWSSLLPLRQAPPAPP